MDMPTFLRAFVLMASMLIIYTSGSEEPSFLGPHRRVYTMLEDKLDGLRDRVQRLRNDNYTSLQSRSLNLQRPIGAFSARRSGNLYIPSTGRTVVFNYATLNNNKAFSTSTGVYTCPVNGVYIFYLTGSSINGYYPFALAMYKNSSPFAYLHIGYYSTKALSTSTTGIVHCRKGQQVIVKVNWVASSSCYIYSGYSSFSGYMLEADPVTSV